MSQPKVTLISWTECPEETLFVLWKASRCDDEIKTNPWHLHEERKRYGDPALDVEVEKLFQQMLHSGLPLLENISLTFLLENVSISFREQMVRHRIATKYGARVGVDMVPQISQSSWWSQTMRVKDMGAFASRGEYRLPESVRGTSEEDPYHALMLMIESLYSRLRSAGIPPEDAREVIPLAAHHRISWTTNLAMVKHIIGKRTCWIAQSELWQPIITQMLEEMAKKINPKLRTLADPPCFTQGEWSGCPYKIENYPRVEGLDPYPPCPLFLTKHIQSASQVVAEKDSTAWYPETRGDDIASINCGELYWTTREAARMETMAKMGVRFMELWRRNPWTGEKNETD